MRKIFTSIRKYLAPNCRRLTKRVERMEGVIGNIVSKIDRVLIKLETMEKSKSKKKQNLGKLFDGLTNDEGGERSHNRAATFDHRSHKTDHLRFFRIQIASTELCNFVT